MASSAHKTQSAIALVACLVSQLAGSVCIAPYASAMGPVPMPAGIHPTVIHGVRTKTKPVVTSASKRISVRSSAASGHVRQPKNAKKKTAKRAAAPPPPPQDFVDDMSVHTIAPGVVHKVHRGAMYINLLDVDLLHAAVQVKPVLAGESFNKLDEVRDQAHRCNAIAAVNGNYFKRDGTPLGTLIIDGEWISGPLMDRTCMGLTADGNILVDRVTMHGQLETSNPDVKNVWVNNINQPRRHGSHLIAYTRRWGTSAHMDYEGTMLAVDATGRIVDKQLKAVAIPPGGYALSDCKSGSIAKLNVGDLVHLTWHPTPAPWSNVVNAVSGGPVLIRDGKLFVGLKDEGFRQSWTSNHIHARTAVGVTADRHLLLATIEGPHTLWDVAKFLRKLGAVDAMNLDGGGSTTMVIAGDTVTKNENKVQRRVASSLVVLPRSISSEPVMYKGATPYTPAGNILDFGVESPVPQAPSTKKTYELIQTPVSATASLPIPEEETTSMHADSYHNDLAVQSRESQKPRKYFGWMKHLNPLAK